MVFICNLFVTKKTLFESNTRNGHPHTHFIALLFLFANKQRGKGHFIRFRYTHGTKVAKAQTEQTSQKRAKCVEQARFNPVVSQAVD